MDNKYSASLDLTQTFFFDADLTVKLDASGKLYEVALDGMHITTVAADATLSLAYNAKLIDTLTAELFTMCHESIVSTLYDAVEVGLQEIDDDIIAEGEEY